jgi:glutathione synthase/RimK-type ligase-like ATP-grasp enzyme
MQDAGDFVTDFHFSFGPMKSLGWDVQTVAWRSAPDWNQFDAVYICTPWDYPQHVAEFKDVLESIEASSAVLFNDLAIVQWNLEKTYMRDMEARGDDIVPSSWYDDFDIEDVPGYFTEHGVDKVVIKPIIGGNAKDTFVLSNPVGKELLGVLSETFKGRRFFVQPFIENIKTEGEYSLFFFNGAYSHAIQKMPKPGDFRVQEEHGADIVACEPPAGLKETALQVFSHIDPLPVYGRGDWVRGPDGRFLLMELELIEPSLYLRTDSQAATRFAAAFNQRFEVLAGE